ncbi:MAG: M15 family metallopeptidase [Oscillospiraceae bacterium]|nr:M15 family metallopeptidase [Oscillospiraceae bacterium]
MLLVNKDNPLPADYSVELITLSNGSQVAAEIYPDLQRMFDDARAQGVYPVVASGFRSAEHQQELMDERIQQYLDQGYSRADAEAEALLWVNPVGTSEHQTGLAVDINADGVHSAGYEVYDWLAENAWQYGFILRYPEDKVSITQTDYEPWHYRYVGVEQARLIYESGLCLEEYLAQN